MKYSAIAQPANGAIHFSEAGSAAETATMVVYSIASCFSSVCCNAATVEFFWPIAT